MMKLPSLEDLNHVSMLMHDMVFAPLPQKYKQEVVAIAQQAVLAYVLDDLPTQISIQVAEAIAEQQPLKAIVQQLEEIDKSLGPIMSWFDKSRLYEP
jgi:hypothetical protein